MIMMIMMIMRRMVIIGNYGMEIMESGIMEWK